MSASLVSWLSVDGVCLLLFFAVEFASCDKARREVPGGLAMEGFL